MRADKRKFHYIYKITRFDGKYYIGMHSTDDLEDGYFGSGQLLWKSIAKHGKEKHSKEILEFLPSRQKLKTRERELVNEEIVNDPLCMNLKLGGEGGGKFWSEEHQRKCSSAGGKNGGKKAIAQLSFEEKSVRAIKAFETRKQNGTVLPFEGQKHSEETKQKMRKPKNQGAANSQFGTCWVTNGVPTKIKKEFLDEYLAKGYRRGRKYADMGELVDPQR